MKKLMEYYKPHAKIILYIVVFVVCFGLAIYLFSEGTYKKSSMQENRMTSSAEVNAPWMKLMTPNVQTYAVGQTMEFTVYADSNDASITGYDLLLSYDPAFLSVVKVTSLDPSIDVFTYNNARYISVTGTKKLSSNAMSPFKNTQILSVQLQAKKAGQTPVTILPQMGRETTKMVDNKAQIITPNVEQPMNVVIQ